MRLTTLERRLLARLCESPDAVVSRETLLEEVWGLPALTLTRAVDSTVRRLRVKIEANPSEPVHLLKVHGEGYRFCSAQEPRAPSPDFFGRRDALARLRAPLPPLLSIVGIRGIGKSRLVQEAAGSDWLMVRLGRVTNASELRTAVALAVAGRPRRASVEAMVELLTAHTTVVFDEAENVLEPLRELVSPLLATPDRPQIIVTSQRHLGLPEEVVWPLEPLDEPAARALFRHASGCPDDPRLAALLSQLDRHPLALKLAAGWWRPMGWEGLSEALQHHLAELPHLTPGERAEHRSLGASLTWMLKRLEEPAAQALRRLAPYHRTLDASTVSDALGAPRVEALRIVAELGQHHLLRPIDGGWRVLAPVRHALPPEEPDLDAHAATVYTRVTRLHRQIDADPAARRALTAWLSDGLAAMSHLRTRPDQGEEVATLLLMLAPALLAHGPVDTVRTWLGHGNLDPLCPETRGALGRLAAEACLSEGDLPGAMEHLQQVVVHHPGPQTSLQQALALQLAGALAPARSAYEDAAEGPPATRLLAMAGLAGLDTDQGQPHAALERLGPSVQEARERGLAFQEAVLQRQRGRALCLRGELASAREALTRSVATFDAFGELRMSFLGLRSLLEVELRLHRNDEVQRLLAQLRRLLARHPVGAWEAVVDMLEGCIHVFEQRLPDAADCFDQALSTWSREGLDLVAGITHGWAAVARHELGQDELARAHLRAATHSPVPHPIAAMAAAWIEGNDLPTPGEPQADLLRHALTVLNGTGRAPSPGPC